MCLTIGSRSHWFQNSIAKTEDGVVVWFADITERKRAESELREVDRRKDEFLAILAHELRNPLAPIRQAAAIASSPRRTEARSPSTGLGGRWLGAAEASRGATDRPDGGRRVSRGSD